MAGVVGRRALRTVDVECPALSDKPVRLREPRVRDFMAAQKATNDGDRTVALLGAMVLDDEGNPIGVEAVLDMPASALLVLSEHVGPLIGEGENVPLDPKNTSSTG